MILPTRTVLCTQFSKTTNKYCHYGFNFNKNTFDLMTLWIISMHFCHTFEQLLTIYCFHPFFVRTILLLFTNFRKSAILYSKLVCARLHEFLMKLKYDSTSHFLNKIINLDSRENFIFIKVDPISSSNNNNDDEKTKWNCNIWSPDIHTEIISIHGPSSYRLNLFRIIWISFSWAYV